MSDPTHDSKNPQDQPVDATASRQTWQEPRVTFVEPELVKQGEMKQITTQGFFGTFVPND